VPAAWQQVSAVADKTQLGAVDISDIDDAIKNVSRSAWTFGAVQNRLEHRSTTSRPTRRTWSASESRIRDVDMAC
jgi:flagellin